MSEERDIRVDNSFLGGDPGAVKYGNFINYYSFHPPEYRINSYLDNICKENDMLILDIGCNTGDLTQKLYEYLCSVNKKNLQLEGSSNITNNYFVYGLDLDPVLITRAKEGNKYPENIFYECLDVMTCDFDKKVVEILKMFNKSQFDCIFCFSISMWIHLNHGDEGIESFINKLCTWTDCIVIEPQPWKCYVSAVRRLKKAGGTFPFSPLSNLGLARNIESNLENIFHNNKFVKDFVTIPSSWARKTSIYRKKIE